MNGGLLWVFIAAPAAVLAAWLFLGQSEQNHAERERAHAEYQLEGAKFDREWDKMSGGQNSSETAAGVRSASAELGRVLAANRAREASAAAENMQLKKDINELVK